MLGVSQATQCRYYKQAHDNTLYVLSTITHISLAGCRSFHIRGLDLQHGCILIAPLDNTVRSNKTHMWVSRYGPESGGPSVLHTTRLN